MSKTSKLFIFAIGGTGSRVLKSLTMLLASGVKPNSQKEFEIIPIIIDPHKDNDDLIRTEKLLENYQAVTDEIGFDNGFFGTRICTLDKLIESENKVKGNFRFNLQQVSDTTFRNYLGYNQLSSANQSLTELLFSGKSINEIGSEVDLLDLKMSIGFVGNPNIGSVVLNQFKDSDEFKEFASNFDQNDRIFIVSSIFGGTGAAGFPTILKTLRNAQKIDNIEHKDFLENAKVGAVTVLPYFNIESDTKSPINRADFISKTKAALHYYQENVSGNKSINALYYLGDDYIGKGYENDPGDGGQENPAHIIELVAALSIIDFMEIQDSELKCEDGKAIKPIYKEFGLRNDEADVKFADFEMSSRKKFAINLSQFSMFKKYLDEHFHNSAEIQPWSKYQPEVRSNSLPTSIGDFFVAFKQWIDESSENRRGFSPFDFDSTIENLVEGKTGEHGLLFKSKVDYSFFDNTLNKLSKGKSYNNTTQKVVKLFFEATKNILTKNYEINK